MTRWLPGLMARFFKPAALLICFLPVMSCSEKDTGDEPLPEVAVDMTATLPEGRLAAAEGMVRRIIVDAYVPDGNGNHVLSRRNLFYCPLSQGTLSATFNLRAENCRLVVWADIVPEETHVSPYYMTGTLNPVSPADPDSYPGNTALKEVFCASIDLQLSGHADGGTEPLDVKLENPAAGYVLVAGDLSRFLSDGQAFGDVAYTCRVRYLGSLRLGYSPLKGIATYALDNISYSQVLNLPASGEEMTVASDSFFLPETGETIIAVELLDSNGETVSYSQVSLRDIEAGSVRTIKGNFLTSYPEDNADISIDGDFSDSEDQEFDMDFQ